MITELFALFDEHGSLVETSADLRSIDELEQLRQRQGKFSSVVRYVADGGDCPELKALRALVYDLESFVMDSGWANLAREIRLRRIWAAGRDRLAGPHGNKGYDLTFAVERLAILSRIVRRALACHQWEKLEDAKPYLDIEKTVKP